MLSNLLFPSRGICLICREEAIKGKHICRHCRDNLEIVNQSFHTRSDYIEEIYYSLFYNRFIREVIKDYKFNGKNYLYKALGEIMLETIRDYGIEADAIIYVPIHYRKEAKRGYNQARLLGIYLSKALALELIDKNLVKYRSTRDQSHLNGFDRKKNLKDAFLLKDPGSIRGRDILLVDDVVTTGSTMEEIGKLLISKGAKRVRGIALTSSKDG